MIDFIYFTIAMLVGVGIPVKVSSYLRKLQYHHKPSVRQEKWSNLLLAHRTEKEFIPFRDYCHIIVQIREKLNISNPILEAAMTGLYFLIALPLSHLFYDATYYTTHYFDIEGSYLLFVIFGSIGAQLWFIWNIVGFMMSSFDTMKLFRVIEDKRVLAVAPQGYYREDYPRLGRFLSLFIFAVMVGLIPLR